MKVFNSFIAFATLSVVLASCAKDDNTSNNNEKPVPQQSEKVVKESMNTLAYSMDNTIVRVPAGSEKVYIVYPTASGKRTKVVNLGSAATSRAGSNDSVNVSISITSTQQTAVDIYDQNGNKVAANRAMRKAVKETTDNIISVESIATTTIDRDAEKTLCEDVLPEKNGNLGNITTDFLYYAKDSDLELEFYPVYGMSSTIHDLGLFYYDTDGNRHETIIWEQMNPYSDYFSTEWKWSEEKGSYSEITSHGIKITIKKGYKFGFYWNGHMNWNDEGFASTTEGKTTYYSSSNLNSQVYCTDGGGNRITPERTSAIHAGTFVRNGKTYLGIEDWTDFDYQDIVFTCNKQIPTVTSDDTKPTTDSTPSTDPITPSTTPDPIICAGDDTELNFNNSSDKVIAYGGASNYKIYVEGVAIAPIVESSVSSSGSNTLAEAVPYVSENIADATDPSYALTTLLLQGGWSLNASDVQTAYHNSGRVLFDADNDESFNDLVLDYDFEAVNPTFGSTTSRDKELRVTLHVRALGSTQIVEAGVIINGINKKVALNGLQWINSAAGQNFKYTNAQGVECTFNATGKTPYNIYQDAQDAAHLITLDTRFHLSADNIQTAITSVMTPASQVFYAKLADGTVICKAIKMIAEAAYPVSPYLLKDAYPSYSSDNWWKTVDFTKAQVDNELLYITE